MPWKPGASEPPRLLRCCTERVFLQNPLRGGRIFAESVGGAHRTPHELTAAVGTTTAGQPLSCAVTAEGALERADQRVARIWRQILVAAFAIGPELQHRSISPSQVGIKQP